MEIFKYFGRVFSRPEGEEAKQNVEEGRRDPHADDKDDILNELTAANQTVVMRNKGNQGRIRDHVHNRISGYSFSVGIDGEDGTAKLEATVPDQESAPPVEIQGIDWESASYAVEKVAIGNEVTAMDVSERFIAVQYHIDSHIDIFDRESKRHLKKLEGHCFGGQSLKLDHNILYSGSMDKTVRSWDLATGQNLETIYNHLDYVQSLALLSRTWVASGGRGDKTIYVYETDESGKLWKRHTFKGHEAWVTQLLYLDENVLASGSEDASVRLWDLKRSTLLKVFPQDEGITSLSMSHPDLLLFGDKLGKLSYLDLETKKTIHLLPNILVSTGCYCRSSKYHDKAVDVLYVTHNGYLITASTGSKFIKIWSIKAADKAIDHEATEIKELQILREHSDLLTALVVHDGTLFSTSSDGYIYMHSFPRGVPHYEMATEQENTSSVLWNQGLASPEKPTEVCEGPRLCRTGKTGLVRSSSSFQVSFQLKPKVASVDGRIRIPKYRLPAPVSEEEEEDSDEEEEEEVVIELSTSEEEDDSE